MGPKRLAIVPARGGSKRIPRKNIKNFIGEPIILKVLREIKCSELFDEIHVSTEDIEIATIVSNAGFPPRFPRSADLADDYAPLSQVLSSVVTKYNSLNINFDTVAMIFPTAVMLDCDTLKRACLEFEAGNQNSQLISICKYPVPIEWAMHRDESGRVEPVDRVKRTMRSQDLNPTWYETADFVFYNENGIHSNGIDASIRGFEVPHIPVDIDTPNDWSIAEILYTAVKKKGDR